MIWKISRLLGVMIGAVSLLVMAIFLVIYLPGLHHKTKLSGPIAQDFSRTDFITIILTAVAIILGALAIVLAVAGAIGYVTVRVAAENAAKIAAEAVAERVAAERAEVVATRVAREIASQIGQNGSADSGNAFAKAEGKK